MQCSEFRKLAGAEPQHLSAAAREHSLQCEGCAEYLRQMHRLDGLLKQALDVPAPAAANQVVPLPVKRRPAEIFMLAASVILAVALGVGIWIGSPRETLAAEVVDHIQHEAETMVTTEARVPPAELEQVLRQAGVRLKSGTQRVSIARTCPFRHTTIPHLVVQTAEGPVTVLVLPHESVKSEQSFNEEGYAGTIVPSGHGAIAIVAGNEATLHEAATEVMGAIEWVE